MTLLTEDEALLRLNDHLDQRVSAAVMPIYEGGGGPAVMVTEGVLKHMTRDMLLQQPGSNIGEGGRATYLVGDTRVHIGVLGQARQYGGLDLGIRWEMAPDWEFHIWWIGTVSSPNDAGTSSRAQAASYQRA